MPFNETALSETASTAEQGAQQMAANFAAAIASAATPYLLKTIEGAFRTLLDSFYRNAHRLNEVTSLPGAEGLKISYFDKIFKEAERKIEVTEEGDSVDEETARLAKKSFKEFLRKMFSSKTGEIERMSFFLRNIKSMVLETSYNEDEFFDFENEKMTIRTSSDKFTIDSFSFFYYESLFLQLKTQTILDTKYLALYKSVIEELLKDLPKCIEDSNAKISNVMQWMMDIGSDKWSMPYIDEDLKENNYGYPKNWKVAIKKIDRDSFEIELAGIFNGETFEEASFQQKELFKIYHKIKDNYDAYKKILEIKDNRVIKKLEDHLGLACLIELFFPDSLKIKLNTEKFLLPVALPEYKKFGKDIRNRLGLPETNEIYEIRPWLKTISLQDALASISPEEAIEIINEENSDERVLEDDEEFFDAQENLGTNENPLDKEAGKCPAPNYQNTLLNKDNQNIADAKMGS